MHLLKTLADTQPQAPSSRRSSHDRGSDTAQPSLASGFGAVLDHERDLQQAIEAYLRVDDSVYATSLHHVVREQRARVGRNIALLEQRYEAVPRPERGRDRRGRSAASISAVADFRADPLRQLIVQHENLLTDIAALVVGRADGQRGELILAEVARSHEEMAGTLMDLAFPETSLRDAPPAPAVANFEVAGSAVGGWRRDPALPAPGQPDSPVAQRAAQR
ncbi:hypothetical protein [Opitutus terrae]|uniref:Uncharacterized protein n=1 Tax=Opitutus terrae (strain DSM 11246 / JCM 15787 / PB90-1) TaxID=452637 RepID=B1ZPJ8_OPITP|nr:hypothetical protein [Opitutus terrae]ACB74517.1 hypothetical protein Oter_1232 [Opitutus terrae PB90-1]